MPGECLTMKNCPLLTSGLDLHQCVSWAFSCFLSLYLKLWKLVLAAPPVNAGWYYWSRVLLPICPCWWKLEAHSDYGEVVIVLLNTVTFTIFLPSAVTSCFDQQTTTTNPFNGPLSGTTRVGQYWKNQSGFYWIKETVSGSGIIGAICKFAPRSRQITTPAPHHSVFTGRMLFLPPTNSVKALKAKWSNEIETYSVASCCVSWS